MKKHISEYSDKEFKALVKELENQPTYLDKVKFVYSKFRKVRGKDIRTINGKEYVFTIESKNDDEKLIKWEYYIDQEAKIKSSEWLEPKIKNLYKSPDKTNAIKLFLDQISKIVNSQSDIKKGYDYGTSVEELNWIKNWEFEFKLAEHLLTFITGLSMYYSEQKLLEMVEVTVEEESILEVKGDFDFGYRLVLIERLGIIDHLMEKFNIPINQPVKLAKTLAAIMGIDITSNKNRSFQPYVKNLLSQNVKAGPKNPTSTKEIEAFLKKIGLN